MSKNGFTLAELLLALAIFGVIAMFTVPKILSSQESSNRISTLKETIGTISGLIYQKHLQSNSENFSTYFDSHLNYIENMAASTADPISFYGGGVCGPQGGNGNAYLLPNGAFICGVGDWAGNDDILIDWNGATGPNTRGDDMFLLVINDSNSVVTSGVVPPLIEIRPGMVGPYYQDSDDYYLIWD